MLFYPSNFYFHFTAFCTLIPLLIKDNQIINVISSFIGGAGLLGLADYEYKIIDILV